MNIHELVDIDLIRSEIDGGYISERFHEEYDLTILNYTPATQYEQRWNDATRICRGLVVDPDGEIIARPFPKFFNYGQDQAPVIDLDEMVSVTDKADGSLLIVFKYMDDVIVATRGSFYSEQAIAARQVINAVNYDPDRLRDDVTYLMEWVGPSNRIVLQYDSDRAIRIADVRNETGQFTLAPSGAQFWDIRPVEHFGRMTFREALKMPPRENAEGLVVYADYDRVVKLKQEDYIELHKIIFNLTPKRIWEQMMDGKRLPEIIEPLPDEFHDLASGYYRSIDNAVVSDLIATAVHFDNVLNSLPQGYDRKQFAIKVNEVVPPQYKGYVFAMMDGKQINDVILKNNKPREGK